MGKKRLYLVQVFYHHHIAVRSQTTETALYRTSKGRRHGNGNKSKQIRVCMSLCIQWG